MCRRVYCPQCEGDITHAYIHSQIIHGWYCANCDLIIDEDEAEEQADD
jgi:hypothetical protein